MDLAEDLFINNKAQDFQLANGHWWLRFHVRIWNDRGVILGNTHYESVGFRGHKVHHFEGAEWKIRELFKGKQNWTIEPPALIADTMELERFNDGMATRISKK